MIIQPARIGIFALIFATAAWGSLFHVGKLALLHLDPIWFTLVRYIGAAALLAVLLYWHGAPRWELLRRHWLTLAGYGMLGYGMFGVMVFIGLSHSVPSHGAVIMATIPVSTLVMRWVLDKQRPEWWAWTVVALAIVGVIMVSGALSATGSNNVIYGDLVALIGTMGWVLYTRGQNKFLQLSVLEYTAFTAMLAVPGLFFVAVVATWLGWANLPTLAALQHVAPAMTYIVVIATVAAALAYNKGVRQLGVAYGVVFINLVPVSALLITGLRGTIPRPSEILGTVLVVTALLMQASLMRSQATRMPSKTQVGVG